MHVRTAQKDSVNVARRTVVKPDKLTDPPELSGQVSCNTTLDGEGENETTREIGEQIGDVLQ